MKHIIIITAVFLTSFCFANENYVAVATLPNCGTTMEARDRSWHAFGASKESAEQAMTNASEKCSNLTGKQCGHCDVADNDSCVALIKGKWRPDKGKKEHAKYYAAVGEDKEEATHIAETRCEVDINFNKGAKLTSCKFVESYCSSDVEE